MQTSSFFHPITPSGSPFSGTVPRPKRTLFNDHNRLTTMAFKKDGSSGKMVDENMIVLRERIRKVKAETETECDNKEDRFSDNLMQWEKTYIYSGGYHSVVYEVIGFLQRFLMETRPSVALGMVAVFVFGGSMTAVMVLQWLINLVQGI